MQIGSINTQDKVFIIAEVGNNHEGDFNTAVKLVELAAESGVDAVKFQMIRAEHFVPPSNKDRFAQLKRFELSPKQYEELSQVAKKAGIIFFASVFDLAAVDFLNGISPLFKVASGDNNFIPLIEKIVRTGKPLIISTGLASLDEIKTSVECVYRQWKSDNTKQGLALLHCVSAYPVPPNEVNLRGIDTLKENFDCTIGYSDHVLGINASIAAVARGARIIEKHFTHNKNHSSFRDHQLSADPQEMAELVNRIREVESFLGSGKKVLQSSESSTLQAARRSIVADRDLEPGAIIQLKDLTWMRPAGGIAPGCEALLIGKRLKQSVERGQQITDSMVE